MKVLLGEGLITSDDPIHIRQRRIAAPAFHRQRIAAYGDQIVACAAAQSEKCAGSPAPIPNAPIDIAAASMELSLEIVARTLFDTEVTDDIRRINDEVNTIMDLYNFIVAFPRIELFMHLPIPGIMKFRKLQSAPRRRRRPPHPRTQRAATAAGKPDPGDLLSMLLSSRDEQADAQGNFTGMSDDQVRDEVLTIFLAGYETVANGLTWTWYLLSQNPEAEAKLHAELDAVLGTGTEPPPPHPRRLPKPQIHRTSLRRINAPLPARLGDGPHVHQARPSSALINIPPGAHFFFSQYMMGRTEPNTIPDPLRFDPDRFSPPKPKPERPKYTYFPFRRRQPPMHRRILRLDGGRLLHRHARSALAFELRRDCSPRGAGQDHSAASRSADDAFTAALRVPPSPYIFRQSLRKRGLRFGLHLIAVLPKTAKARLGGRARFSFKSSLSWVLRQVFCVRARRKCNCKGPSRFPCMFRFEA